MQDRKKILGLVVLILVAFFGALVFRYTRKMPPPPTENAQGEKILPTPSPASEKIKTLYQSSRLPLLPKKEDHLSVACSDYLASIRGVDLRMVKIFPPKSPPFPSSEACKDVPRNLQETNEKYLEACAILMKPLTDLTQKIWFENLPPCVIALFNYRAQITQFLTRNLPIEDIEDPKILLDKMLATFPSGDYRLNEKIAERLLVLEPTLVQATELIALSKFMLAQTEASGNPSDRKWEELDHTLQKLVEQGAVNPKQALEWQLMINLSKNSDLEESRRYAERMASQYPEWGLPLYYEAWAVFKQKDAQAARKLLEQARKKDPNDLRAKEAIEKIYKNDPNPFRTEFSVTFPKEIFD